MNTCVRCHMVATQTCWWQRRLAVRYNAGFLDQNGSTHDKLTGNGQSVNVNVTKQTNIPPSTCKNHSVLRMWRALGDLSLQFAIIVRAIQKGGLFSYIFCQFSPFRWSNFDLELISFPLFMNTSSCNPIASGIITVGE